MSSIGAKLRELSDSFDANDLKNILEQIREGADISEEERQAFCQEIESQGT